MENKGMFMKYYLVDYDSVKQNGVEGIENLTEKDKVFIFYTEGKNTIEISFFEKIHSSSADIKFRKISGDDSLSGTLSSCTGYIVGKNESAEVCIVSRNDKYSYINDFWKGDYKISMQENISGIVPEKPVYDEVEKSSDYSNKNSAESNVKENPLLVEEINNLKMSQISKDKIYEIINCARKSFPNAKKEQRIYVLNRLRRELSNGNNYFRAIQPYI